MKKLIGIGAQGPEVEVSETSTKLLKDVKDSKEKILPLKRISVPKFMEGKVEAKPLKNIRLSPNDEYKRNWKCIRDVQTVLDALLSLESEPSMVKITYSVKSNKTLKHPAVHMKDTKIAVKRQHK